MKHLLTLLAALLAPLVLYAQPAAAVVPPNEPAPPTVQLPPPNPVNVAKFDPTAVKARNHPYHVTLTKAPEAWAKNPAAKGKNVRVAILDTYAEIDHPGLNGQGKRLYSAISKRLDPPKPARVHPHAIHVGGIVHSMAPEADLYFIEVLDSRGSGSTADIAHGIDYATNEFKVDVICMSLGGPTADPFMPAAIKRATDAGLIVVAASGNDGGGPGRDTEGFPARYPGVISVGACDSQRRLASFSSWGPSVLTVKPGVAILSLLPKDNAGNWQEGEMDGTSMACPGEAGAAAGWVASNAVPKDRERWRRYRDEVIKASPFTERNNARGYGLYTLDRITGEANTAPTPPPPPKPGEKVYTLNVAELQRQGYTSVRIDLGAGATSTQPIPVASVPVLAPQLTPQLAPQCGPGGCPPVQFAPPQFTAPAPVFSGPGTVFQGFSPPPPVYQPMPSCGPGGCRPQQPQYLFAPFGGRFR